MSVRKMYFICLVTAAALMLSGCDSVRSDENRKEVPRSLKIGVSMYDQYDTYIGSLMEYFLTAARDKEKESGRTITVRSVGARGKQSVQNEQVEAFIEQECDIICVNLVDRTDPTLIIDRAKRAGVPVIFFNRELVQEDLKRWDELYYVGAQALESGILQGELVVNMCTGDSGMAALDKNADGKLQYVILEGEAGHQDALMRTEYVAKTITQAGIGLEKLANEIANWSRAQAQTKMQQWYAKFGETIELIIANNDDMALGAIDALKDAGLGADLSGRPAIVGIDGTAAALAEIRNGYLDGTVYQDAAGQAKSMLELAYSLQFQTKLTLPEGAVLSGDIYIRLPHRIVTAQNVDALG